MLMLGAACTNEPPVSPPDAVSVPTSFDVSTNETAPPLENEPVTIADRYRWEVLSSGAGGFVTGASVSNDGSTLLVRTDVGGAYRRNSQDTGWEQLLGLGRVDDPLIGDYTVESAAVAPNHPDRIYLSTGGSLAEPAGRILISDDRGATWTASSQRFVIDGNAEWRVSGERLAVSPTDPDHVWLGTRTEGLWRSVDGAASFTRIDEIPIGASERDPAGVLFVVIDDSGERLWAGVAGVGVHRSTDGGDSWQLIAPSSGLPMDAELGSDGRLWVAERDPGVVTVIDGDVVTSFEPQSGQRWETVAVDPTDPMTVLVGDEGIFNHLYRTDDGGASWRRLEVSTSCPEIPWLDAYSNDYLPTGSLLFDPVVADRVWVPEGFGVWRVDLGDDDRFDMACDTLGIEELVSNDAVGLPGGRAVTAHWDRSVFHHGRMVGGDEPGGLGTTPEAATQGPTSRFNTAWDLDVSASDPEFVVAVIGDQRFCCEQDGQAYQSGSSTDGGLTWTPFESYDRDHPDELRFGNIAVATGDNDTIVWLPTFNGALHRSTDRGATWDRIILPGTESMVQNDNGVYRGGSHQNYFLNRKVLAADRVEPDTFYLYHQELGIFRSVDGGATWAQMPSDGLPTGWTVGWFSASLTASNEEAGRLLFSPGFLEEATPPLYESRDGGSTWRPIAGTSAVDAVAFGPGATAEDSEIVYFAGELGGRYGIWRSEDDLASWQLVSLGPLGNYQRVKALAAAPDEPGTIYVGFSGTSFMVGAPEPTGQ